MFNTFKFIIWCYLVHFNYAARRPVSPCPNVFQFEGEPENDRWSGVINFSSNIELAGLTYKIQLDRPAQLLVSWDGEVRSDDNILFHVNNQYRVQRPGEMGRAQIMVKFDPAYGTPGIAKIVINGNTVCSLTGEGRPSGQNNGNRVPGVVLSVDSTTERIDPSFENEDTRPDYSFGSSNGNTNYGTNFNQGNPNLNNPNRIPTGNNYGNQNIPSNTYGNSNGPYGGSNSNSGSLGNPIYSNSNQPNNNNGPPDVHYSYNPPVQTGTTYVNNRPQFPDNSFNTNNNPNQGNNWQNNNGGGNSGFSNSNNANNNPQSNSPYNGTIYSANNPQQILQLFNNLLNQQQNQNASSPAFVVAILPVPSSPDPVASRIDPTSTTESQKFKQTAFTTSTTSTTITYPTTSSTSNINRIRTNTTTLNTKTSSNNNNTSRS